MNRVRVVIASPVLADANNGNWQTAQRWRRMLAGVHAPRIVREWPDAAAAGDEVMLALHARRSAPAIAAWAEKHGACGLAVVLTGTDLYRDIASDASAQRSLAVAHTLVVLQEQGPNALPDSLRGKARVIFQSATSRRVLLKTDRHLRAVIVGHLREEKDPLTPMAAARVLRSEPRLRFDHLGASLDLALGDAARATMRECPRYRWLGAQPHEATRRRIQHAHVLIHASRMEGGAHVVMEAICAGTPVLASDIPGNVGMLGTDYAGFFEPGDAEGLVALLREALDTLGAPRGLLARLAAQCERRAPLFEPAAEQQAVLALVASLAPL